MGDIPSRQDRFRVRPAGLRVHNPRRGELARRQGAQPAIHSFGTLSGQRVEFSGEVFAEITQIVTVALSNGVLLSPFGARSGTSPSRTPGPNGWRARYHLVAWWERSAPILAFQFGRRRFAGSRIWRDLCPSIEKIRLSARESPRTMPAAASPTRAFAMFLHLGLSARWRRWDSLSLSSRTLLERKPGRYRRN